ncbi:MAG: metallophosphoesterase [Polyangiaceae bacterium]|nr:metallophosphoesterase [Polyangiaceae bacterium]
MPPRRTWTIASVLCAAWLCGAGCIRSTPFGSDPSVRDLTAKQLAKLAAQTPPPRYKFVALGDTHADYDNLNVTIDAINDRHDIEFVLIAGDMTVSGLLREFERSYEAYSRLDAPFLTVMGNHDAISNGPAIYRKMYGPYDYSFHYGQMKFVMFNSNTLELGPHVPNRAWLSTQVDDQGGAEGVVLTAHHALMQPEDFPDGDVAEFYEALVQRAGVSGVLHGHHEDFVLADWHGVPVLQCGTYEKVFTHAVVTVEEDGKLSFERCEFGQCEPVAPTPESELP